jgi:hypothetical protein
MTARLAPLLCALLLAGCGTSRVPFEGRPTTQNAAAFAELNRQMERGQFRIEPPGYVQPLEARAVRIERDSLFFQAPDASSYTGIALGTVRRVYARERIGSGEAALVGMVPGLLLAMGGAVSYGARDCSKEYVCGLGGVLAVGAGLVLTGLGALTGAVVGTGYSSDWAVAYIGPAAWGRASNPLPD